VSEKKTEVVDPSNFEKSFMYATREFGLILYTIGNCPEYESRK
jgi:hypothetical protein